ncbi:AbrB/MazE/SpoVT family DNA-binding domain-containing protein [Staphylococcus massiliensis]|uniref:AbrB family transcriptional regulator n=1 Tax=Staphylococcus massiliensis S46 TaxID=1229783 RepID=K9ANV8_9STAP|nr:AbrB/MazE/SpoVT family DNA-binding domain-containing protein [Staphylococcus massiliensis]EKU48984.1 AbrB family transcriptional regulator [Staphylococcus massiliensis S46]MCG3399425.1 AbrB/MazE/SpoVT family DNA-binding domain-containing protein [Staphylococcus massiliensis]MCG3411561.1 AbrB/MazE/SpoVT family DNA-binding domain-containing protein [Staphylococcus massiliensis]PNZ98338.1 AbrB/MazE/SpoVT family DNA-binding domain-containing protein [Staphylococcus massiliensis CCUG 55927]
MKTTGIVRKVDPLGRIVIPKEIRSVLDIKVKDPIEIFIQDDTVMLRKYSDDNACMITGETSDNTYKIANGKITLSQKGAEQLLTELEDILK